jgi:hypothetical protein
VRLGISRASVDEHVHRVYLAFFFNNPQYSFSFYCRYGDDAKKILVEPLVPAVASTTDQKLEGTISSEELLTRLK